jgi:hypothetical protein
LAELTEFDRLLTGILAALDKLHTLEVPRGSRPVLRLVLSVGEAVDRDPTGEGLRAFLIRRGWDLWTLGGESALFGAVRAALAARPDRKMWIRHVLSALWVDIGEPERDCA